MFLLFEGGRKNHLHLIGKKFNHYSPDIFINYSRDLSIWLKYYLQYFLNPSHSAPAGNLPSITIRIYFSVMLIDIIFSMLSLNVDWIRYLEELMDCFKLSGILISCNIELTLFRKYKVLQTRNVLFWAGHSLTAIF